MHIRSHYASCCIATLFNNNYKHCRKSATMSVKDVSVNTFTAFMNVYYQYIPDGTGRVILSLAGTNIDEEIVFNIGARARYGSDKNVLVLNTKVNGKWKKEMRPPGFPFTPGTNTAVTALCNVPDQVIVYANGNHIADYSIQGGAKLGDIKGIKLTADENKNPQLGIVAIGRVSVCVNCIMLHLVYIYMYKQCSY